MDVHERSPVNRRATGGRDGRSFERLAEVCENLPDQPWPLHVAFPPRLLEEPAVAVNIVLDGDEPAGAVQTTIHDGTVGVWSMATLPARRRRGVARAGLTYAVAERCRAGGHSVFLIATDAGRPLYDAVGFRVVDWCTVWLALPHVANGPDESA